MVNLLLSLNNFDENWCYSILKNIIKDNHNVLIIPFSYDDSGFHPVLSLTYAVFLKFFHPSSFSSFAFSHAFSKLLPV